MNVPSLLSVLICDTVIVDAESQKKTLVGLFDMVAVSQVPFIQKVGFYAKLTDLEGTYTFRIRLVQLGEEEQLLVEGTAGPYEVDDRLTCIEIALNLPPVPISEYGRYEFQFFANDMYVGRAMMNVVRPETKPQQGT